MPTAFIQLIAVIVKLVHEWCPEEIVSPRLACTKLKPVSLL